MGCQFSRSFAADDQVVVDRTRRSSRDHCGRDRPFRRVRHCVQCIDLCHVHGAAGARSDQPITSCRNGGHRCIDRRNIDHRIIDRQSACVADYRGRLAAVRCHARDTGWPAQS